MSTKKYIPLLGDCMKCKIGAPLIGNLEKWLSLTSRTFGDDCPQEPHEIQPCSDLPFWAMPVEHEGTLTITVHCTAREPLNEEHDETNVSLNMHFYARTRGRDI